MPRRRLGSNQSGSLKVHSDPGLRVACLTGFENALLRALVRLGIGEYDVANRPGSRVQAVIVTIAAAVTITVGAIKFWNWYWSPATELHATVEYGTYRVDPWTATDMSVAEKKLNTITSELNAQRIAGGKLSAQLEKFADDAFKVTGSSGPRIDSGQIYGYMRAEVTDKGSLGAKDVALRVPNIIGSMVTFDDGSTKVFGKTPTIDLGNLRPDQKVIVYSWLYSAPAFFSDADNPSLTYAGGKGKVDVQGRHGWVYGIFTSPFMDAYFVLIAMWGGIAIWRSGFDRGRKAVQTMAECSSASDRNSSDSI